LGYLYFNPVVFNLTINRFTIKRKTRLASKPEAGKGIAGRCR